MNEAHVGYLLSAREELARQVLSLPADAVATPQSTASSCVIIQFAGKGIEEALPRRAAAHARWQP